MKEDGLFVINRLLGRGAAPKRCRLEDPYSGTCNYLFYRQDDGQPYCDLTLSTICPREHAEGWNEAQNTAHELETKRRVLRVRSGVVR